MVKLAEVLSVALILCSTPSSAISCESGSCVQDETSLVQLKQTVKHGDERDEDSAEAAARVAEAKMAYKRRLMEQELVLERYATSKAWIEASIGNAQKSIDNIEHQKRELSEGTDRKTDTLRQIWKDQYTNLAEVGSTVDEKERGAVKKKAEQHAEKAMVHLLAKRFMDGGKKKKAAVQEKIQKIVARDAMLDKALDMESKVNMKLFEKKVDAQLHTEEVAMLEGTNEHARHAYHQAAHRSKEMGHDQEAEAETETEEVHHSEEYQAGLPGQYGVRDKSVLKRVAALQIDSSSTSDELPRTEQRSDQDVALDEVNQLADEARRSFYGTFNEAHVKLASAKMLYKKALIEQKLRIQDLEGEANREQQKIERAQEELKQIQATRDEELAKAVTKSRMARDDWARVAKKYMDVPVSADMKLGAEKAAHHVIQDKLLAEQKANYDDMVSRRTAMDKKSLAVLEADNAAEKSAWGTQWKALLESATSEVAEQEKDIL